MPLDATAKYAVLIEGKLYPWNTDFIDVHQPSRLQEGKEFTKKVNFRRG